MKKTLLIITALLFITSTVIPQSKVNINNLVEYGGKMFKQDDDKPYTGSVFDLYKSTGEKKLEGRYRSGLKDGKWSFWNKNGQKDYEKTYKDGIEVEKTEWTYYHGRKQEITYKYGEEDGLETEWWENGQKAAEGTLKDGKNKIQRMEEKIICII